MYGLPQFPLINFREPVTRRGKTRMEVATSYSLHLGQTEVAEICKTLATGLYNDVTVIEACLDGQVKRRYTVKNGKIIKGVHFAPTDYLCARPLPLRIPPEA